MGIDRERKNKKDKNKEAKRKIIMEDSEVSEEGSEGEVKPTNETYQEISNRATDKETERPKFPPAIDYILRNEAKKEKMNLQYLSNIFNKEDTNEEDEEERIRREKFKREQDRLRRVEALGILATKEAIKLGLIPPSEDNTNVMNPRETYYERNDYIDFSQYERDQRDTGARVNRRDRPFSRIIKISDIRDFQEVTVLYIDTTDFIPHHLRFMTEEDKIKFIRNPTPPEEHKNRRLCLIETFSDLESHLFRVVEVDGSRIYICPIESCKRRFGTISLVKRHYLKHANIRPYKCTNPLCDKYFSRKDNQQLHSSKCNAYNDRQPPRN